MFVPAVDLPATGNGLPKASRNEPRSVVSCRAEATQSGRRDVAGEACAPTERHGFEVDDDGSVLSVFFEEEEFGVVEDGCVESYPFDSRHFSFRYPGIFIR